MAEESETDLNNTLFRFSTKLHLSAKLAEPDKQTGKERNAKDPHPTPPLLLTPQQTRKKKHSQTKNMREKKLPLNNKKNERTPTPNKR